MDGEGAERAEAGTSDAVAAVREHGPVGVFLRGICMGAADAVPGVSGGTIALLTGIYGRLVAALTAVSPGRLLRAAAVVVPSRRADGRAALVELDTTFLLALGAGILAAVVTVTRLLDRLLAVAPVATFGLFFGLIAASAVVLRDRLVLDTPARGGALVAGAAVAYLASGRASAVIGTGPLATAFAGAVAVSAMVLPGVSGSLLLLVLGQYERMIATLRAFVDALVAAPGAGLAPVVEPGTSVAAFVAGALVGLLTVAHAVRAALAARRAATVAFLVGLVVGALRAPYLRAGAALPAGWTDAALAAFLASALVGAVAVAALDRAT
jgi:putative membrane protein